MPHKMRRLSIGLILVITALIFGYAFMNLPYSVASISSHWQAVKCSSSKADNGLCTSQNVCIAPIAHPNKGFPLRYQKASLKSCNLQTNSLSLIIDWFIAVGLAIIITKVAARLIDKIDNKPSSRPFE